MPSHQQGVKVQDPFWLIRAYGWIDGSIVDLKNVTADWLHPKEIVTQLPDLLHKRKCNDRDVSNLRLPI